MAKNNTDILNEILLDLEILIEEQSKGKDNKNIDAKEINLKIEGHEDVVALLTGLGAFNNDKNQSIKDVAKDIETLANGLKMIQEIDAKKIKSVKLEIKALISDIMAIVNNKEMTKMLSNVNSVIATSAVLGRSSANIEHLAESLEALANLQIDKDLAKKLLPVLDFLAKASVIGNNKNALSGIKAFLASFGPIIALKLRFFFYQMSKIANSKNLEETMRALNFLVYALIAMGNNTKAINKGLKSIQKIGNFDKKHVKNFTEFFNTLLSGLPSKRQLTNAEKLLTFLKDFMLVIQDMPLLRIYMLASLGEMINPEAGSTIAKFLMNIIEPLCEVSNKKMKQATNMVNALGNMIIKLVLAIGIMTLLVALDLKSTLIATGIVIGIIVILVGLSKLLTAPENEKGIDGGAESLNKLCSSLLYVTAAIGIMALLIKIFDIKEIKISTGIVLAIILILIGLSKLAGSKDTTKTIDNGTASLLALCKCLLYVIGAIAIMSLLITIFDPMTIITGAAIVLGIIGILVMMVRLIGSIKPKQLDLAKKTVWALMSIILVVSLLCIFAFPAIAGNAKETLIGASIVIGIIAIMALITFALSLMDDKKLKQTTSTMVILTAIVLVISLIAILILVPLGQVWDLAAIGAAVVIGVVTLMTFIVFGLSKIDGKNLKLGVITLLVLTAIVLCISLIAMYLLIPIGEQWQPAAIGGTVILSIIGVMTAIVFALSKIDKKNLRAGEEALAVLTAILGAVSYIVYKLFIPIGEQWKPAALGGTVVLSTLAILTAIGVALSKLMKTIDKKLLILAGALLAGMTTILTAVSLIVRDFFIPIGQNKQDAAIGGAIVLSTLGIITAIGVAVSKMVLKISIKDLAKAAVIIGGMVKILELVSKIVQDYFIPIGAAGTEALIGGGIVLSTLAIIEGLGIAAVAFSKTISVKDIGKAALIMGMVLIVIKAISELMPPWVELCALTYANKEAAMIGGPIIITTLGVFGGIMIALGSLKKFMKDMAIGGVILSGIGGVLWVLGNTLPDYFKLVAQVAAMEVNDVVRALLIILATLTAFGLIMGGVGMLTMIPMVAVALAAGAATLSGIALVINLIGLKMPIYFDLVNKVNEVKNIEAASNKILGVIAKFGALVAAIGMLTMIPFFGLGLGIGVATLTTIALSMALVKTTLLAYADVVTSFSKLNPGDRANFEKYMTDTDNGFVGTMNKIMSSLNELGLKATVMAAVIAMNMRPIFITILDFMKVIQSFGTLKMVTEWDEKGKPIAYEQMSPEMFKSAAEAISSSFCIFVAQLGIAMKSWDKQSIEAVQAISKSLGPVMKSVGSFVNAICKFISMKIADDWDKDGKPTHFKSIDVNDFAVAADTVANSFGSFLDSLATKLEPLSEKAMKVLNSLKDGIEPVMSAVGTFTKAIMEIMAGTVVESSITDKSGKEKTVKELVKFNPSDFSSAALTIGDAFITFLDTLYNAFKAYDTKAVIEDNWFTSDEVIKESGNTMAEFINSMSNVGAVINGVVDLTKFIIENAENISKIDMVSMANKMAGGIIAFIDTLKKDLGGTEEDGVDVEAIAGNMKHVLNITNVYKKIYEQLQNMVDAITVFQTATDSMKMLLESFIDNTTLSLYESVSAAIDSTINPTLTKAILIYHFFDKLEYNNDRVDVKRALKNVKMLLDIMNEFTRALEAYNNAPKEFSIDVIQQIGQAISDMYNRADNSYIAYYGSFSGISKKYTSDITKTLVPTINKLISSATNLHKIFVNLDKQLINQKKKREEALNKLAEQIRDINSATRSLAENLDKVEKSAKAAKQALLELAETKQQAASQQAAAAVSEKVSEIFVPKPDGKTGGKQEPKGKETKDPMKLLADNIAYAISTQMASVLNQFMKSMQAERPVVFKDIEGSVIGKGKTSFR